MPLLVAPTSLNDKLQQQRFVILGEVFPEDIPVRIKENRYLELSPVAGRAKKVSALYSSGHASVNLWGKSTDEKQKHDNSVY